MRMIHSDKAKTDKIDADKLASMLRSVCGGDQASLAIIW